MNKFGIDLGGTKIEGIVLDENNKEIYRKRIPNGKEKGYDNILNNIQQLYTDLIEHTSSNGHTLGLGTPGSISKQTGLLSTSNIQCMNGKAFQKDLAEKLGHNIVVENDANCFALAEALIGAGKGKEIVFGVIIGTGCGGGLIIDGKVIRGLRENAGEWGHHTIDYSTGPEWTSGVNGVIEAYISGTGVQKRYESKYGEQLAMADIVYNYRKGEADAVDIFNEFLEHLGISLSNLIKFLDPDVIVMGGGLSNIDEIYTDGLERVKKYVFDQNLYTPIVKNEYGDSAGVFGAALIGVQ